MHIPDKYRDRYDRLAASHPWMREMRDEQAPEGDEVELMRECCIKDILDALGIDCRDRHHTRKMVQVLADMVERDYVRREKYDSLRLRFIAMTALPDKQVIESLEKQRDELKAMNERLQVALDAVEGCDERCKQLEAERDESLEIRDKACGDAATFKAERDDWKIKCETYEFAYKQADAERKRYSEQIDELFAERDEWKAKAEGSSKVRVSSSSAKRAAAVERLKANPTDDTFEKIIAAAIGCTPLFTTTRQTRDMLIDLLADEDANDDSATDSDVNATDVDVNDGNDALDSREKLEADALSFANGFIRKHNGAISWNDELYRGIIELLDRQAAITEREHPGLTISDDESLINWHGKNYLLQSRVLNAERERDEFSLKLKHEMELNRDNRNALDLERIAELRKQVDSLTVRAVGAEQEADELKVIVDRLKRESTALARDLGECMAERDELRGKIDQIRSIANEA